MSEYISFLITVLYGETILKCGLKVKRDSLIGDIIDCPMEPENKKFLHELLPMHVKECGPIIDVEEIFEIESK